MFSPYGATAHYGKAIRSELEKRGAIVNGYDERPSQKTFTKITLRLFKKTIPQIFDGYIRKIIKENSHIDYDFILICRGEAFTPLTINHLKNAFPRAKVILYLWDILRTNNIAEIIPYCDRAFSFDPQDVHNIDGLQFRPTFFVPEYLSVDELKMPTYDVIFIGTLHSNRYKQIKHLKDFFDKNGIGFYMYLYVPSIIVYLRDLVIKFPFINIKKVHFSPISLSNTIKLLNTTKAIIDINYPSQKSLSTRAFEAMAARRKYITTNANIAQYDFYNPNNISIVDIDEINIDNTFFDTPFEQIEPGILREYSVEGLIDVLFE